MPTIGIDFKIKMLQAGDQRVKLQLWDTAGQERFQTITTSYYKGALGVVMVYDCTQRQTFNSILNWSRSYPVCCVLLANLCQHLLPRPLFLLNLLVITGMFGR